MSCQRRLRIIAFCIVHANVGATLSTKKLNQFKNSTQVNSKARFNDGTLAKNSSCRQSTIITVIFIIIITLTVVVVNEKDRHRRRHYIQKKTFRLTQLWLGLIQVPSF